MSKQIVVVGGGFAGMWAALAAAREAESTADCIAITVVSRDEYLTMRPRLYERDPARLREPLRPILDSVNVSLRLGTVRDIDAPGHRIDVVNPAGADEWITYDRLILATGSHMVPPPIPGLAAHSWNVDTHAAAMDLDGHLRALAAKPDTPGGDTVIIIGGGFTGIELACEMRSRLAVHGGNAAAARARIMLVEQADVVGPDLGANPRPLIKAALTAAGIEVRLKTQVTAIFADAAEFSTGERIASATTIVATGLRASPLSAVLAVEHDALGRLPVDDYLRVQGTDGIYACGDVALALVDDDNFALMSCQHAMPMGRFAGHNAACDLFGRPLRPYRQPRYVTCLDLGPAGAVFTAGWQREVRMTGTEAKQLKQKINSEVIYPPKGGRNALLAAAEIAPPVPAE
jgi:NADH dehydrogenase